MKNAFYFTEKTQDILIFIFSSSHFFPYGRSLLKIDPKVYDIVKLKSKNRNCIIS